MGKLETFTIRELRERTGELVRQAESGRLSLVTKHGHPVFVAVPVDEQTLERGYRVNLAVRLFELGSVTLAQGAKLAGMTASEFIDSLGRAGVSPAGHGPEELRKDIATVRRTARR